MPVFFLRKNTGMDWESDRCRPTSTPESLDRSWLAGWMVTDGPSARTFELFELKRDTVRLVGAAPLRA